MKKILTIITMAAACGCQTGYKHDGKTTTLTEVGPDGSTTVSHWDMCTDGMFPLPVYGWVYSEVTCELGRKRQGEPGWWLQIISNRIYYCGLPTIEPMAASVGQAVYNRVAFDRNIGRTACDGASDSCRIGFGVGAPLWE